MSKAKVKKVVTKKQMKGRFDRQNNTAKDRVLEAFGDFDTAYAADMQINRGVMSFDTFLAFGETFLSKSVGVSRWLPLNEWER